VFVTAAGLKRPLKHHVHHSPDGFECGYGGSGPADLALALAADAIGAERERVRIFQGEVGRRAWDAHMRVKAELVTTLPRDGDWTIFESEVLASIARVEQK
jgi:hypothetical protein